MRILIVGNGGREHALLWKLRRDAPTAMFYATRPNPGMEPLAEAVDLAPTDVEGLATWADGNDITLTVVGPEVPLARGIGDAFRKRGLPLFGPSSSASRIESSKAFAKDLMRRVEVPTAEYRTFTRWSDAEAFIAEKGGPLVVKASGLAAGKGAFVCPSTEEALEAAREMLTEAAFGDAGSEIVVEEFMEGEELSVFAITDGRHVVLLLPSQDYKRIGDGDTGPNTGGMGAYAPVPLVRPGLMDEVRDTVFLPILDGMESAATPFRGLLYAGLMLTPEGTRVVEFNCRFGDPEAQVVIPMMESSLLGLMVTVARGGSIADGECRWSEGAALNTVLASEGYPGEYGTGRKLSIPAELEHRDDLLLFHAGTRRDDGHLVTAGGRVLSIVGLGDTLEEARTRSLEGARAVEFEGKVFRKDIGRRALRTLENLEA